MPDIDQVADALTALVEAATAPLMARIAALEQRQVVHGRDGRDGLPGTPGDRGEKGDRGDVGPAGKDADVSEMKAEILWLRAELSTTKALLQQQPPSATATPDQIKSLITDGITAAVSALPVPKDGAPGPQGPAGERGEKGDKGDRGEAGPAGADGAVGPIGPMGPAGERGEKGDKGDRGEAGPAGADGAVGPIGPMGPAGERGEKGLDGRNGQDGLGFEDMSVVVEDDGVYHVYERGDRVKRFRVPSHIYRDVWKEAVTYQPGETVTWGGSMWIAKTENTNLKPGNGAESAKAWKLCVKAGRDGKTGPEGKAGPVGPAGPKGDRGPDKW